MRLLFTFFFCSVLLSCKQPTQQVQERTISNESTENLQSRWKFDQEIKIEGASLKGLATFDNSSFIVSDENKKEMYVVGMEGEMKRKVLAYNQVNHINSFRTRLMIPSNEDPKVQIWRNDPYTYELKTNPSGVTSFVALTIEKYSLVDSKKNQVHLVHGENEHIIGKKGAGPLEFDNPTDLYADYDVAVKEGTAEFIGQRVFIVDSGNKRIQVLDLNGAYLYEFGKDVLSQPEGIYFFQDRLFVTDVAENFIAVFSKNGDLIEKIEGNMQNPYDLIEFGNRLYVSNGGTDVVSVFKK